MALNVCFFYGTLMSPEVLSRVISGQLQINPSRNLIIHPAELTDHQRHKLKGLDYPGVVASKGHSVIGTVVYNLSDEDVTRLDIFEGDEYERRVVSVFDSVLKNSVMANVYIWTSDETKLTGIDWDLELFTKSRMQQWISDEIHQMQENDPRGR